MNRIFFVLAITLFVGVRSADAQAPNRTPLDPATIKAVDPLYPGFIEILERDDSVGLVKLARTLSAHPSLESLAVLLWMLRYCPSWPNDGVLEIDRTIRAVGTLPLAPVAEALVHAPTEQRLTAAGVLAMHARLVPESDKPLLDERLVAALSDSDDRVQNMVLAALRARDSAQAKAAVHGFVARREATAPERPPSPHTVPRFPAATTALLESLDSNYHETLKTLNDAAVRRLLEALQRSRNAAGIPVLVWLLANGDSGTYGGNIVYQLSMPEHAMRLPFRELAEMLSRDEPDRSSLIAELFANVFSSRTQLMTDADRRLMIAALIDCLEVAHVRVRTQAVEALGRARAARAVRPIVQLMDQPGGGRYQTVAIRALAAIGTVEVVPTLERLARSGSTVAVRDAAASAYIAVTKPSDPGAHVRRLLWEQPDTALEKRALAEGKRALPSVWQALAGESADERRVAAALLGWFRDTRSIAPILTALDAAPGALTREQLLFDLNMILLTEAPPLRDDDRNALAALHLQWLHDELLHQPIDSDIRSAVRLQKTVHVHPDGITAPFSVTLSGAAAVRSPSPEAFLETVRTSGMGVAFHAITGANGVARVATTLYLPKGRIANQVWISLYRHDGRSWTRLPVPSHPVLHRLLNEPNLMPAVNRNYGPGHPLKVLRLDLTMERIRVDLTARDALNHENVDNPINRGALDASYLPLLERYRGSDSPAVKYSADFEYARLTGQPNLDLWIAALSAQSGTDIQKVAVQVLGDYLPTRFKTDGRQSTETERLQLVTAALKPEAVHPRLVPAQLAGTENITDVRHWSRFALVTVRFGSSGYSMLFERRVNRWVFLCVVSPFIE